MEKKSGIVYNEKVLEEIEVILKSIYIRRA
jgi:hypothetical protein